MRQKLAEWAPTALKTLIILWALLMIGLALLVDNPWLLAGILLWEVLP